MQCGNCGLELVAGSGFCGNCGAAILVQQPQYAQTTPPVQAGLPQAPPLPQPGAPAPVGPQVQAPSQFGAPPQPYPPNTLPKNNDLAIIALVMLFVFSPAAIVLGIVSLNQIKRTHERGREMALTSIILGIIFTILFILLIAVSIMIDVEE